MRASAILIITALVILVSASAHATHKSWIICPKQAVMLIFSLASTPDTDEQRKRIRERWCYDLTVPHEQVDGGQPDRPGWKIPYDAVEWIAFEVENSHLDSPSAFEPGTYMYLKNVPRLGLRRIAEEWSWESGTQSNTEILTRLLSAFWRREFVGHDAPDPLVTLSVLKHMGAFPREYWDDENPPTDEFEFLASIPPNGYDEPAPECYGTVAWSILDAVELPAEVLAGWCDAYDISKPIFWFGSETRRQGTAKAKTDSRKWLAEEVKKGKSGAKV